jgi:hypothetical protein
MFKMNRYFFYTTNGNIKTEMIQILALYPTTFLLNRLVYELSVLFLKNGDYIKYLYIYNSTI